MTMFKFETFPRTYGRVWEVYEKLPKMIERGKAISEDIASRNAERGANYSPEYYLGETKEAKLAWLYNVYGDNATLWALAYPWTSEGYAPTCAETLKNLAPTT
jgi:hypothetical protein